MKRYILYMLLTIALILVVSHTLAAVEEFSLSWWTVDSGGGTSQGNENLEILGSIGQPDAGLWLQGDEFAVSGGFLPPVQFTPNLRFVYLPVILR